MKKTILTLAASLMVVCSSFAQEYKIGDLMIDHPVARATPVNAPVSGGYMTITNMGAEADRLISVSVSFAGKTEIHEMAMDGDVMKMRELADGIEIPAGGKVELRPGGFHLMFMSLNEQLQVGEKRKATLTFEKAGTIEVDLNVETLAQIRENLGGMEMKMDHSGHSDMEKPKAN